MLCSPAELIAAVARGVGAAAASKVVAAVEETSKPATFDGIPHGCWIFRCCVTVNLPPVCAYDTNANICQLGEGFRADIEMLLIGLTATPAGVGFQIGGMTSLMMFR